MDLHAAAGALVLGRRRRAEAGGLRRTGLAGLLLHLRFRLRQKRRVYTKEETRFIVPSRFDFMYFKSRVLKGSP